MSDNAQTFRVTGSERSILVSLAQLQAHGDVIQHYIDGGEVEQADCGWWYPCTNPEFIPKMSYRAVGVANLRLNKGDIDTSRMFTCALTDADTLEVFVAGTDEMVLSINNAESVVLKGTQLGRFLKFIDNITDRTQAA